MGNDNLLGELDAILVGGGEREGDNLRWNSILLGGWGDRGQPAME